MDEIA